MTSSLSNQIQQWSQIKQEWQETNADYAQGVASLINWMKEDPGHRAGDALWRFQMWLMPEATQSCEYQMGMESDALNIANSLRNDITNAQNAYNNVINDIDAGKSAAGVQAAQSLENALNKFSQDMNHAGLTKIMGTAGISNLKNYLAGIRGNITGTETKSRTSNYFKSGYLPIQSKVWNNGFTWCGMGGLIPPYGPETHESTIRYSHYVIPVVTHVVYNSGVGPYTTLKSAYNAATKSGQEIPPLFTNITSAFNNLNQSVSGISSTIQANMQYLNNNLQQLFGIFKSFFDDFSQLSTYIVQKSTGS